MPLELVASLSRQLIRVCRYFDVFTFRKMLCNVPQKGV